MGAWGLGNFENDSAIDWLHDFLANPKLPVLEEPAALILQENEFIDSEESLCTLAAAEVIATLNGFAPKDLPKDIEFEKIKITIGEHTINMVIQAVYKILYFEHHSELRVLWEETDDYNNWVAVQTDLIKRLKNCLLKAEAL
jgi:hypothetical protein